MKEIGVSDEQLKERWGEAVWAINAENYDSGTLEKAYNKIVPEWDKKNNPNRTREQKIELIKNALNRSQVATAVVKKTLPNLFSREKAAAWKESHELITKCASLKREDLQDIAAYINSTADKNIDIEGNKTYLIAAIKNVISTGLVDGDMSKGKIDSSDNSAALIRALKANRFLQSLKARINKPSKFLDKL
jgi:hypothetical protein